jgi:putative chitinase
VNRQTITPRLLKQALRIPALRAEKWAIHLEYGAQLAQVEDDLELAHFIGQIGHETGCLFYVREVWGPTSAQVRYERNRDAPWPASPAQSRTPAFAVNRLAYALGNHAPGDGKRYMGRGLLQTTGRGNHIVLTDRLKDLVGEDSPDFVTAPALLESPEWASLSAGQYWRDRKLGALAREDNLLAVTKKINGGTNGLAHRQALTTAMKLAIQLEYDAA